jgi:hypothetical protein
MVGRSSPQQRMSITLTREQLYQRVWTDPIDRICSELGLSNVGLRKLCLRHDIPVPPRGYWAKKKVGKRVRQSPLPPRRNSEREYPITFDRHPRERPQEPAETDLHLLIAFERQPEDAIVVSETCKRSQAYARRGAFRV